MVAPAVLAEAAYLHVWTGNLNVSGKSTNAGGVITPGRITDKQFFTYVEVSEQGAHDPVMRSLAQSRGLTVRPMHRGRVNPNNAGNAATAGVYYAPHGQMAASLAGAEMIRRWTNNTTNSTVFVQGQPWTLVIQAVVQNNGHCYEVTMWYDVGDIYVAFHCYDPGFRG